MHDNFVENRSKLWICSSKYECIDDNHGIILIVFYTHFSVCIAIFVSMVTRLYTTYKTTIRSIYVVTCTYTPQHLRCRKYIYTRLV